MHANGHFEALGATGVNVPEKRHSESVGVDASVKLPTHIATADEQIPALGARPGHHSDMRTVTSIGDMIASLNTFAQAKDDVGYVALFRQFVCEIGVSLFVQIDCEGSRHLMISSPADVQIRHRWRWLYFLLENLDAGGTVRDGLMSMLVRDRWVSDSRPADLAA